MDLKDKVLKYGSLITVFVMPLLYMGGMAYPQIAPKTFFFYGAVDFLSAFWIYALLSDPAYRISKKTLRFFVPLFAFVAWMTIAGILAVNPHLAFFGSLARGTGLLTLYHALLFSLIATSLFKKFGRPFFYKLLEWFVWGGFILSLSVWFGSYGFNLPYQWARTDGGGGLTGNSSLAGAYLLFAFAFGVILLCSQYLSKKGKWRTSGMLAVILFSPVFINIYGLFSSWGILSEANARGALLGIFAGGAAAFSMWAILSSKKLWRAVGVLLVIAGLASFSYLWIQLVTPGTSLHEKFTQAASGTRFIFWQVGEEALKDRPWFGYGQENYMIAFQKHFNPKMLLAKYNHEAWNDQAHNIYYDTGVSGGYPAITLYALFLLSIFWALYRTRNPKGMKLGFLKEAQLPAFLLSRTEVSILGGLVIAYIVQGLFYFDSNASVMALLLTASVAFWGGASEKKEKTEKSTPDPEEKKWKLSSLAGKKIAALVLAVLFVFPFIYFSWLPFQKAVAYATAFERPSKQNFDNLKRGSGVGEDWDVGGFAHDMYKFYATNPLSIKNDKQRNNRAVQNIGYTLDYLEWLAKKKPYDFRLYSSIVLLHNTKIFFSDTPYDPALADHLLSLLNHAKELSPTNPEVYWDIAQIMAWKGDLQGVVQAYENGIKVSPTLSISYQLLIQFARALNDRGLYNLAVAQAQKNVPGFVAPK